MEIFAFRNAQKDPSVTSHNALEMIFSQKRGKYTS